MKSIITIFRFKRNIFSENSFLVVCYFVLCLPRLWADEKRKKKSMQHCRKKKICLQPLSFNFRMMSISMFSLESFNLFRQTSVEKKKRQNFSNGEKHEKERSDKRKPIKTNGICLCNVYVHTDLNVMLISSIHTKFIDPQFWSEMKFKREKTQKNAIQKRIDFNFVNWNWYCQFHTCPFFD